MARVTDPAFAGFDATAFRSAIRSTMTMAAPNSVQDRVTFRWTAQKTYARHDPAGKPYSWTSAPVTDTEHADVQVPAAVQFVARPAGSVDTVLGEFDASRVILTVLDVDFALVEGADVALIGQNTYEVEFVAPPQGLFEVDIYQIYLRARDES